MRVVSRLAGWLAEERGQMLAWTLIVTMAGGLIIGGFLVYATTSLLTTKGSGDQARAYYTADAGAERCLVSLTLGDTNCNFTLALNGYTGTVAIEGPLTVTTVPTPTVYIATGLEGKTLGPGEAWLLELDSRQGLVQVNWPFTSTTPVTASLQLTFYQGRGIDGSVITTTSGSGITGTVQLAPTVTDGVHTLLFWNSGSVATVAAPFSAGGGVANTWVWANAYRDYIITSQVEGNILKALVRQTPGSSLITNPVTVTINSWQFR